MNRGIPGSLAAAALLLAGCISNDDAGAVAGTDADVALLMMGNSHTSVNNLPGMLEGMVASARAPETVGAVVAPGWMFLDDRYHHAPSLALLRPAAMTKGRPQMSRLYRTLRALAATAAILTIIAITFLTVPPLRAIAQDILRRVGVYAVTDAPTPYEVSRQPLPVEVLARNDAADITEGAEIGVVRYTAGTQQVEVPLKASAAIGDPDLRWRLMRIR